MFNLIRRSPWIQTVAVRLITAIHPSIEHNIAKTMAVKKAFYRAFLEEIAGDYLEFGTFAGTSLIAPLRALST